MKIEPFRERNRREAVVEQVLKLIQTKELKPGERLPTETSLASLFRVSRTVIREAMQALQATGIIRIEQGRGTFISPSPLQQPFNLWASINRYRHSELYEVRLIIESETAARAAKNATAQDIDAMASALQRFQAGGNEGDWHAIVAADCDFHRSIAWSTGLELLAEMLEVTVPVWTGMNLSYNPERIEQADQEHKNVLKAIRDRDPDGASKAMVIHIRSAIQRVEQVSKQPAA